MMKKAKEKLNAWKYKWEAKRLLWKAEMKEMAKRGITGDNRGIAVVEIILILVIVMALIVVFRKKIIELVKAVFREISGDKDEIIKKINI